jgi:hypothetical protein
VRLPVAPAALLTALLTASRADADSYSWGGSSGRFDVEAFLSGFNEGAGAGGWDTNSASEFATWAARFNAVIPAGSLVSLSRGIEDDGTAVVIREPGRITVVPMAGGPDLDAALPVVAGHFGMTAPPPVAAKLFTVQLFATQSELRATRFAEALNRSGVHVDLSFFHEECHPCSTPEAHVVEPRSDGIFRVVIGIFDHAKAARRSVVELRSRGYREAFLQSL